MNKAIFKDMFKLKMEIIESTTKHLPSAAKERFDSLQYDLLASFNEAVNEYLEKKKPYDGNDHIRTVPIE